MFKYFVILFLIMFNAVSFAGTAAVSSELGYSDGVHIYKIKQHNAEKIRKIFTCYEKTFDYNIVKDPKIRENNVKLFLKNVGVPYPNAWCAAFMEYCFDYALKILSEKRGDLAKSASARTVFNMSRTHGILLPPTYKIKPSDIIVFKHGNTSFGHIGTILKQIDKHNVSEIDGNTSGTSSGNQRMGNGVWIKSRPIKGYGKSFETCGILSIQDF